MAGGDEHVLVGTIHYHYLKRHFVRKPDRPLAVHHGPEIGDLRGNVTEWQEANHDFGVAHGVQDREDGLGVPGDVVMAEHDALRVAGSARGVDQGAALVDGDLMEGAEFREKSFITCLV